ncbi:hypothetical protein Tco_1108993 [Tanacetum coccineum]
MDRTWTVVGVGGSPRVPLLGIPGEEDQTLFHDAYETNCADIGYGFLPFSFSSFGELEKDAVAFWGIREGCDGLTEADLRGSSWPLRTA